MNNWLKQHISFKPRDKTQYETLKYGAYMLDTLIITWILNATSTYEIKNLVEKFNLNLIDPKDMQGGLIYNSSIMGCVRIGHGIIHLERSNMLWDRNMLLMFKDTSTARFHSLFSIEHRQFEKYDSNHLSIITEMYKLGDEVLAYNSINSYDVFGLIEPISSLLLSRQARKYRPLIPEFPHFTKHVDTKISDVSKSNPKAPAFLKHLYAQTDKHVLLTIYGSFRHWGHPFINYFEGLKALHKNVTSQDLPIDESAANTLASDLAFKILYKEFQSKKTWFVDIDQMEPDHPLYDHVENNTWPSIDILVGYPSEWHQLPLRACWEIPEVVDPSLIYSDKTHSIQKSELITHLQRNPNTPIPTRKVLKTLLQTPSTNWPEFLDKINRVGLDEDDLVIGLKAKEREIKQKGRFFALMSWALREYFVFTEYMIKRNVLPLFKGLTMADDQTALLKKMINNSAGQGGKNYDSITIANHIDYEKWNNFQRKSSTTPVFKVIGQFFGLPNLFSRTHEFFEKSLIYYRDRPDLMVVKEGKVQNRYPDKLVCWEGQLGGLEGLRQKGWSVLNLLVIERAGKTRNTEIKILAQGDNQVICTFYKIAENYSDEVIQKHIAEVEINNESIIEEIRRATLAIGLKINEDETDIKIVKNKS